MSTWQVRREGSPTAYTLPTAEAVENGLRDGIWVPTDEVKGPADADWVPLDAHPDFHDVTEELAAPMPEAHDDTHLDMNPLIDVCLVLLIFFILTISYASLERAIAVPQDNPEDAAAPVPKVQFEDIKDRIFRVKATMDGDTPVVKVEDEVVPVHQLEAKMKLFIDRTGRKEMLLDADGAVPWGVLTAILDAAKGNGVHNIISKAKTKK
ncbi:MAG: biopolymer transporter ExbD [Gemmataceae bacterium]|nr:biopolymer transporter ExbD [Gemmataceae bacterium]